MADTIQIKAGNKEGMPRLTDRELAYVRDEKYLYIGTEEGNVCLNMQGKDGETPVAGEDYFTPADKLEFLKIVYPVGAVYLSTVSTSPATLFGFGTWERIKDTFLLSAGDTYAAGAKGGSPSHKHIYGLKVYEYYSTAAFNPKGGLTGAINIDDGSLGAWTGGSSMAGAETLNASLGSTTASANPYHYESRATTSTETHMPPYLAVYVWKRTA